MASNGVETPDTAFLSDLLGSIGMGKVPEKNITDLNLKILTKIVTCVPLRERMGFSYVSQQFRGAVKASITSLNFYRDCLDCLPDNQVKEMLEQYGSQITALNFDLFKSTFVNETSQWVWRQTVLDYSSLCPNLTELSILICNRHRLRDKDLVTIFEKCPQLTKLCVDAQFLNGHCFKKAPLSLAHIEMEMCYRISDQSLRTMFGRFRKMKILHFSQLLVLTDAHIALMVRCFRNLQELSIVSHVDTKYESLTGSGLAELGKLQKLRVLCLEGLGAVTDRTLTVISDANLSPTATTITALSMAFCYNVSQHGLKHLGRMTSLVDLNIDGITKRDVSMGVEKIAAEGRLVRLFVAERTNISPEALVTVVQSCPHLRLLDISNNEECFNWVSADKMMYLWCNSPSSSVRRAPLTILTDEHLAWNIVNAPEPDEYGRSPVLVVHINRGAVPENELLPTNALSDVLPSELPPGLLAPYIRRGNRYRLLWAPLGPSKDIKVELFDEHENGVSVAELAMRAAQDAEDNALERSSDSSSCSMEMEGVECVGVFGSNSEAGVGMPWNGAGNEENMAPPHLASDSSTLPSDFSFTPISTEGDPHTKDWSMDVVSLLLKTYAYEDGAMVGPMTVKEGIIMRPDGSVEDICSSILQVGASLRARYHMTSTITGARRCGPHAYNAREVARAAYIDPSTADIASAIDDFLVGYVPEEPLSQFSPAPFEPSMQHLQPRPKQLQLLQLQQQPKIPHEFAFDREMIQYHMRSTDAVPPFPLADSEDLCSSRSPFGHCENEAPAAESGRGAAAAAAATGYYVPGGRGESAGSKVAPVRIGGHDGYRHQQRRQEYGSLQHHHHHQRHQEQHHYRNQEEDDHHQLLTAPRSAQEKETMIGFHNQPGSGRKLNSLFVPMRHGGCLSAPPISSSSSFPFPPPSHLLPPETGPAPSPRPLSGRIRGSTTSVPSWLDASGRYGPAPHPYQAANRSRVVLRPRN
ncbi:hypothetical protein PENTCL1PPCAC_9588 [Pristionchus entomophagus]|uniref:F-box domain-containing protein n=1 Tax=Pristionchus entomophagus TaxID=358040 RepID=A0AAV5SZJ5_9BILA|nr:hypothetical protein PENTCL1PPCAC_9588 [Pristionchus entomophagus]